MTNPATTRDPNSVGFWRRNSIEALRVMTQCFEPPADPEEMARRDANTRELRALCSREEAVLTRYRRSKARTPQRGPTV